MSPSTWGDALSKAEHRSAGKTMPYRVFAPKPAKARLPLVVFLHGAGERGRDNEAQLIHGVRDFVTADPQSKHPCILIAPQCPREHWWHDEPVYQVLADLISTWTEDPRVDPDRVYLTGLSMGGFGTWHVLARHPHLFAAALPICGGGKDSTAELLAGHQLTNLPVWNFHGEADRVVPPQKSTTMLQALRRSGNEPKSTVYPDVGHNSWTRTYADPKVRDWLFAQRRLPPPRPLRPGQSILFLGDSITAAGAADGGYVRLIEAALRRRRPAQDNPCIGAGVDGHRVPDLQARLDTDVLAKKPAIVIIYIGINDVWQTAWGQGTPKKKFATGLEDLIGRLRNAGIRPVLCTPSVLGEKTDGTNPQDALLEEYAGETRRIAATSQTQLLDLRRLFLAHLRAHNPKNAKQGILTRDGVHLNAAGQRFVADRMLEALHVR